MAPNGCVRHADVEPIPAEQSIARPPGCVAQPFVAERHQTLEIQGDGDEVRGLERRAQPLLRLAQRDLDALARRDVPTRAHEPKGLVRLGIADSTSIRLEPHIGAVRAAAAPGEQSRAFYTSRTVAALDE